MSKQNIRPLALAWLLSAMLGTAAAQTAKRVTPPPAPAEPRPVCVVAEFKGIGLHTHDPQERSVKAAQWLQRNGSACTLAQAITITSNRSAWLGTADTPMLMASIEGMVESRQNAAAATQTATAAAKPMTPPGTPPTATPAAAAAAAASAAPTAAAAPAAATTTSSGAAPAPTNRPAAAAPVAVPVVVPVAVPAAPAARPAS